ncbi:MAG: FAD-binding domain-containing protein, partial [Planctomycetota bacterium]
YSPIKQAQDQDPRGVFIRRWVPELEGVEDEHLAEPHKMPGMTQHMAGCLVGDDYPEPIVNHARAYARAKERIFQAKAAASRSGESGRVYQKHGSRRRQPARPRR